MDIAAIGVALFSYIVNDLLLRACWWNAINTVMLSCVGCLMFGNAVVWDASGRSLSQIILMTDFGSGISKSSIEKPCNEIGLLVSLAIQSGPLLRQSHIHY